MLNSKEKAEGWVSLFDGEMLDGWSMTGKAEGWIVEDGCILCTTQGGRKHRGPGKHGPDRAGMPGEKPDGKPGRKEG